MKVSRYSTILKRSQRLVLRPYKLSDFQALRRSFEERLPCIDKFDEPVAATKETDYALPETENNKLLNQIKEFLKTHPLTREQSVLDVECTTDLYWSFKQS
jgi:hypothetical protein